MKQKTAKLFFILLLSIFYFALPAQKPKTNALTKKQYPAFFKISKTELNELLSKKTKDLVKSKTNKYLDNSTVVNNVANGDTKFIKIRSGYFNTAFLTIQVNGIHTTQVFILSDDQSVFYKGTPDKDGILMTKCNKDDIVSE